MAKDHRPTPPVAAFTDAEDNQPAEEPVDRIEEVIPKGQLKHA
jgi:hypothetical protein